MIPQPTKAIALKSVGTLDFDKGFSSEQVTLLKDAIAKDATDAELQMFMYVCERKKLDPFAKQIYPVKRWDAALNRFTTAYQTGIDGFRVTAKRSGKYRGQVGPFWCGEDGVWKDVWLGKVPPSAAKVGVKHADFDETIWGVATWDSYVQTTKDGKPNSMWTKMCDNQLAKCAESLALRKAFPEDLSGLHSEDEMGQADNQDGANEKVARLQALKSGKPETKEVESVVVTEPEPLPEPKVVSQGPKPEAPIGVKPPKVEIKVEPKIAPEPEPEFDVNGDYVLKANHPYKGEVVSTLPDEVLNSILDMAKKHAEVTKKATAGVALEDCTRINDYLRLKNPSHSDWASLGTRV